MKITLPDWYDDLFEFECESKGCVLNFTVTVYGQELQFDFYDITRFVQTAKDEVERSGYYNTNNLVILDKVTRENIIGCLNSLNVKPEAQC